MNRQIGIELSVLRKRSGKTIIEVANDVGIDAGTLSRYENNKNSISVETLEKLLDYYKEEYSIFFNNVCENMHN